MNEIPEGLFELEEKMPCLPEDIKICRFVIPSTLGKTELEEVAARILFFSQEHGQWLGVSEGKIKKQMLADLDDREAKRGTSITILFTHGVQPITDGIRTLMIDGMLRKEEQEIEGGNQSVYFPTPKLINTILEKQG